MLIIAIAEIQENGYYISFNSKKGQPGVTRVWKLVNTTDFNTVWILTGTVWILTGHTVFLLLRRDNIQIVAVSIASINILYFHQPIDYHDIEETRKTERRSP